MMITMENVCKSYRIAKRNAGFKEAFRALFHREYEEIAALKDIICGKLFKEDKEGNQRTGFLPQRL